MFTKIIQRLLECSPHIYLLILFLKALSPNQICSVGDKMLIKRFDKLQETHVEAQWIMAGSAGCFSLILDCSDICFLYFKVPS